jgi:hypothetical protein
VGVWPHGPNGNLKAALQGDASVKRGKSGCPENSDGSAILTDRKKV